MEITFTKKFIIKLLIGILFSVLFLLIFSIIFQENYKRNYQQEKFKPKERIEYLSNISIDSKNYFFYLDQKKISLSSETTILIKNLNSIGCTIRQKALIFSNLLIDEEENKLFQTKNYIDFLNHTIIKYFIKKRNLNCSQFIKDINFLNYLSVVGLNAGETNPKSIIESHLTEYTSWDWKSPCIYYSDIDSSSDLMYLSGPLSSCINNKKFIELSDIKRAREIRVLGNIIKKQLSSIPNKNFEYFKDEKKFLVTLDPHIQGWLNIYKKCFENLQMCEFLSLKNISKLNNVSVIVMNRDDSSILGSICVGKQCNTAGLSVYSDLASLYTSSPPASISKLFYALPLASSKKIEKKMLSRQIKTSGQLDPKIGRRNEWWEKKVICDSDNLKSCDNVVNVVRLAKIFGISTSCPNTSDDSEYKQLNELPGNFYCGRISLGKSNHLSNYPFSQNTISGFMGFLPLTDRFFLDSEGTVKYVRWEEYEKIRRNKNLKSLKKEYLNTSNVIQSVLGGGESRISALGMAALIAQINQLSNKRNPVLPSLVKIKSKIRDKEINLINKPIFDSDFKAAKNVILGMQKVVLPAENGWKGDGTAHASFKKVFKKNCPQDCPILGKTGTVSYKDKNFVGTTLFSGLVDSKGMMNKLKTIKEIQNLAIGVIVFSQSDDTGAHHASQLFMSIVKDLFSDNIPSELIAENRLIINKKYLIKNENRK